MANHPIHVVTAWIGNTPKIVLEHDLQTLESDFAKAVGDHQKSGAESGAVVVQKAVQTAADANDPEKPNATGCLGNQASRRVVFGLVPHCSTVQIAKVGLELNEEIPTNPSTTTSQAHIGGAESGAVEKHPVERSANLDVLAAFIAVLTPEQRVALARLLRG